MAKYLVTSNSNYKPYTYEELAAPVQQAAELHRQTQSEYDTIATNTAALNRYITNGEGDRNARRMYDEYNKNLQALQDDLWQYGYGPRARRSLSVARQGYSSDIARIAKAIETRQAKSAEYHKYIQDHPDAVMGIDPGLSGLDNYLANDLYGSDYFVQDGAKFAEAVGKSAKARVKELLRDPVITQQVPGFYTRYMTEGATSGEVLEAKDAVNFVLSGGDLGEYEFKSPVSQVLAEVLMSHLQSTGAPEAVRNGRLSESEFMRLVSYGGNALGDSIGETVPKDLDDKLFDFELEMEKERQKAALKGSGSEGSGDLKISDSNQHLVSSPKTHKAMKETGITGRNTLIEFLGDQENDFRVSSIGGEVHGSAEAASLVYSEDLRRKDYEILGFDIGRDPGNFATSEKKFLSGKVTHNGVRYNTRYNPFGSYDGTKGVVEVQTEDGGGTWMVSPELTSLYHRDRGIYEDTLERYKKDDKETFKMAGKMNPDEQWRFYDHWDVDFGTVPLTELRDYMTNANPATASKRPWDTVYLARTSTDKKYVERLSDMMSDGFNFRASGRPKKDRRRRREAEDSTYYIHEMTDYGSLQDKAIRDPKDVFKFDDNNNITNIRSFSIDLAGIMGDYVIVELEDSNKKYAVNIEMFGSDALEAIFERYREEIKADILALPSNVATYAEKVELAHLPVMNAIKEIKDRIGYIQNGQVQGDTKQENAN